MGMFVGYAIGYYAIEMAMPYIAQMGYASEFESIKQQAAANGFWLLLIAGFTPIPFKIFTLASGAVGMPLLPFFFGALIGAASACSWLPARSASAANARKPRCASTSSRWAGAPCCCWSA